MSKFIATFGYVGLFPFAPGTAGSLAALPFGLALLALGGASALLAGAVFAFGLGWWATGAMTAGLADHDPSEIVIDEVAGQWLALLPLATLPALWTTNAMVALAAGFVLFRLFDITKPFPVSWADNMTTPFGVMFDDILAGLMAAIVLYVGLKWTGA